MNTNVIAVIGPTAVGKTALAMALADEKEVHLISMDSAMIYRGMDIGTGKPDQFEQAAYPHALIDIVDIDESYSVAKFLHDVEREIIHALEQKKLPVVVGGTMMYYAAMMRGVSPLPSTDPSIRERVAEQAQAQGWPSLHAQLRQIDPLWAAQIKENDQQRISRGWEVFYQTGQTLSQLQSIKSASTLAQSYNLCTIGVWPKERAWLHQKIAYRFDSMLKNGFQKEVESLIQHPKFHDACTSMRAVGYRQMLQFLQGVISHEDMRQAAIAATRQLAKRQMTWMRQFEADIRLDICEDSNLTHLARGILKHLSI